MLKLLLIVCFFFIDDLLYGQVQKKSIDSYKKYKIVIDPGHGGTNQKPYETYGDKYDPISGKYLEPYKVGAIYKNTQEKIIALDLAKEVKRILDLTKSEEGFKEFQKYLQIFTNDKTPRIEINSVLSREDNVEDRNLSESEDQNANYRLYDYRDSKGKNQLGRISKINKEKPYLVIALHLTPGNKQMPGGMASVITPSYRTFFFLKMISQKKISKSRFNNLKWKKWSIFESGWNELSSAIADAWIYFSGYWTNKSGTKLNTEKFEGYRQNMVTWRYRDTDSWIEKAKNNESGPYSSQMNKYLPTGKFWDREKAQPEIWRREDGKEGMGGDNFFAGQELLRFVQYGLRKQMGKTKGKYPSIGPIQPPFISTYSLPTYVNAICAYLEIGYINKDRDIKYLTEERKKVAISLAVGIYSLFHGIKIKTATNMPYKPKGTKINFAKYETLKEGNYFSIVSE